MLAWLCIVEITRFFAFASMNFAASSHGFCKFIVLTTYFSSSALLAKYIRRLISWKRSKRTVPLLPNTSGLHFLSISCLLRQSHHCDVTPARTGSETNKSPPSNNRNNFSTNLSIFRMVTGTQDLEIPIIVLLNIVCSYGCLHETHDSG